MANVTISALPQVTVLTNTDVFPAVATATTSKITLKDLANTLPQVSSSITASNALTASLLLGSVVSSSYSATASLLLGSISSASFAATASRINTLNQGVSINGTLNVGTGNQNTATYNATIGTSNIASGNSSMGQGLQNTAFGNYSLATGIANYASEYGAHAEGWTTIASGTGSHAEGYATTASNDYSHAEGWGTIASGKGQHAQGQFNISRSETGSFIIGNGTSNASRSNLIFASGSRFELSGSLLMSGSIIPNAAAGDYTSSFSLGSSTNAWKDLWVSNGTIYLLGNTGAIQGTVSSTATGVQLGSSVVSGSFFVKASGSAGTNSTYFVAEYQGTPSKALAIFDSSTYINGDLIGDRKSVV